MMYAIILANFLSFAAGPALQAVVSNAVDPREQGVTMGALNSINSIMFVVAPLIGTPLLAAVSHLPAEDWRVAISPAQRLLPFPPRLDDAQAFVHSDSRFRCAIHSAHRAPGARAERVLRNPSFRRFGVVRQEIRTGRDHSFGRPEQLHRRRSAARSGKRVVGGSAGARHLLRDAGHGGTTRRCGRERAHARIRLCANSRARPWPSA